MGLDTLKLDINLNSKGYRLFLKSGERAAFFLSSARSAVMGFWGIVIAYIVVRFFMDTIYATFICLSEGLQGSSNALHLFHFRVLPHVRDAMSGGHRL